MARLIKTDGTEEIVSLPTYYNEIRFLSRLEARWAVFFDILRIQYHYEPEGFKLKSGECFLPDFFLPNTSIRSCGPPGTYVEVKGSNEEYHKKYSIFWDFGLEKPLVVFVGMPPPFDDWHNPGGTQFLPVKDGCWEDHPMIFYVCPKCKATKIEFPEGNYFECNLCGTRGADADRVADAANRALKYQFVFGRGTK